MDIHQRISIIRKELKMTTRDFAKKLNISCSLITNMEKGKRAVTSRTINDICREFNINEKWLRYGNGTMFSNNINISLDEYAEKKGASELDKSIMKAYLDIPKNERIKILSLFKSLLNSYDLLENDLDNLEVNDNYKNNNEVLLWKASRSSSNIKPEIKKFENDVIKRLKSATPIIDEKDL